MRSKMVIDRLNEMKMKLGSKVTLRKAVKQKWIPKSRSKLSTQPKENASKKPWTWDRVMIDSLELTDWLTDIAMVPPILMAG